MYGVNNVKFRSLCELFATASPVRKRTRVFYSKIPLSNIVHESGVRYVFSDGYLHCENGPAIETSDGTRVWMQDGILDRTDGPAIEPSLTMKNAHKCTVRDHTCKFVHHVRHEVLGNVSRGLHLTCTEWYIQGVRNRVGGPAFVTPDGWEVWFTNGINYNPGGPSIRGPRCTFEWHDEYGRLHRDGDYALCMVDDVYSHIFGCAVHVYKWFVHGELARATPSQGPCIVWRDPEQYMVGEAWVKDGVAHRDGDLPAYARYHPGDGIEKYYKNGVVWRKKGPAEIIYEGKTRLEKYYSDGKLVDTLLVNNV